MKTIINSDYLKIALDNFRFICNEYFDYEIITEYAIESYAIASQVMAKELTIYEAIDNIEKLWELVLQSGEYDGAPKELIDSVRKFNEYIGYLLSEIE